MHGFDAQITFCYTEDIKAVAHFYEDLLGLKLKLEQGGCRIYHVTDTAYLGFCDRKDVPQPAGVILTLVTDDVDGWCDRLREHGITFEKEPAYNPDYLIYHCFLRDPAGYLVEIQRFEDPRW